MSYLQLTCLGELRVQMAGAPLTGFQTDKMRALLVYLALEGRPHQRRDLTSFLWPGYREDSARNSFRQYLHQLRQLLRDDKPAVAGQPPWLLVTRQTVQFNPAARLDVDVVRFTGLLADVAAHAHAHLSTCPACLARLRAAMALYQGDFLAGFTVADSDGFEEWRRIRQEQLHLQALEALHQLADAAETAGDAEQALQDSHRQLAMEPWQEVAHRRIMRILARRGQRAAALAQYRHCRQVLAEELGAAPAAATTALYEQIRAGAFETNETPPGLATAQAAAHRTQAGSVASDQATAGRATSDPVKRPAVRDWDKMPTVRQFHGRTRELATVTSWVSDQRCRLVLVLGIGGVGKSTLAAQTVRAVADQFDAVIWSSLLNAPPPGEILRQWLRVLTQPAGITPPEDEAEQFRLLMQLLRQQRCLLVLDNVESILLSQPGADASGSQPAGTLRPGYEGYTRLLQSLGEDRHRSCLLITSRELPHVLSNQRDQSPTVQVLALAGLETKAGQALLQAHGLAPDDQATLALVNQYSGNPLALQIVSHTIADLYAGDIAAFTAEGAPIFDDIRVVLDQQLARLSRLESELLLWLAIEREPITPVTLRNNLLDKGSQRTFLEALRALQRRSLLEKIGDGFTLQNVIIEYLTDRLVEGVCAELLEDADAGQQTVTDAAASRFTQSLLNRHALLKVSATESVRQSQVRLILHPIVERLLAQVGKKWLVQQLQRWLDGLRAAESPRQGYAAGNLLNLLLHLEADLSGFDFSGLAVWRADFRGAYLPNLDLTDADLSGSVFTHSFGFLGTLQFNAANELMLVDVVDNRLRLWQLREAALYQEVALPNLPIFSLTMSRDCKTVAFHTVAHQLMLVDLAGQQPFLPLRAHAHPIWRYAFSPDDQWLISGDASGLVCLWDRQSGQLVQARQLAATSITAVAVAPDGETIAAATVTGTVYLWSLTDDQTMQTLQGHTEEVATLSFAQNGHLLAAGSHDTTVCVWEVPGGQLRYRLRGHTQPVRRSFATATGPLLITGGPEPFVYVWDLERGVARHLLASHGSGLETFALSPDGNRAAILDRNTIVSLWDTQQGQRIDSYPIYRNVIAAVDFSPDGGTLLSGGGDGALYLWQLRDGPAAQVSARIPAHKQRITGVAFSADGQLLASSDDDHLIRLWDRASHQLLRTLDGHTASISGLAFSPDGQLLASSSYDGTVGVWSVSSGQRRYELVGHNNIVSCCAFSAHGNVTGQGAPPLLATGSLDQTILLWDTARGEVYQRLLGHTNGISRCAFSADSRRLISTSYDHTCCVWDTITGQRLATWETYPASYITVTCHPVYPILAVSGDDHIVRLLDLESGQLLAELHGHQEFVVSLRFHPQGQWLASAAGDQTIRLWDVAAAIQQGGKHQALQTLKTPGPYAGMKLAGVTGISAAQKSTLQALGAVGA
jgi:WD40 repeat protein/DNA-binding SARP family transcriptional activator